MGHTLFADMSYDALSMDEIARRADVAKGLVYYYFGNKRGYYLAVVEDAAGELLLRAAQDTGLPRAERLRRTLDDYLRYAEQHQSAYRTIATGGVGHDTQVLAIRERARDSLLSTLAESAWGSAEIPAIARTAMIGWLSSVEAITLDWLQTRPLDRDAVRELLVRTLHYTLRAVEDCDPTWPAPTAER
ncbi:TetR/AcrR family transcriptional regulator [Streptacidiphilus rugosus]|uniref:TetR/AcrR family transcriptional regulator n=1 Tax=Streptacidiphilus rugosus TaxID=405783 RepID=UPI000ACD0810